MLRSAAFVISGNAAAAIFLLFRNLLAARLLSVEDFGIAATFAIAMAVFEMATEIGLQQQMVQSKSGDDPHFQAALQGFQVMRGALSTGIFFLLAGPAADFMGVPEAASAYRILAILPLVRALMHLDSQRLKRHLIYRAEILSNTVSAMLSALAIWPLALVFGDWRAMLWAIVLQIVSLVALTHLLARRPFRIAFDRRIIAGSLAFGWPLLVNNVLLFGVLNGDRILVGRELGMAALAIFAVGYMLTLTPTQILAKSAQSLFLPQLSRAVHDPDGAERRARLTLAMMQGALGNGALLILGILLFGRPVVEVVLGDGYAPLVPLLGLFATLHAIRVFKTGPAIIALAHGRSGNAMVANTPRLLALPLVWLALERGKSLEVALWIGIAAETVGFAVALGLVTGRVGVRIRPLLPAGLTILPLLGLAAFGGTPGWPQAGAAVLVFALHAATLGTFWRFLGTRLDTSREGRQ